MVIVLDRFVLLENISKKCSFFFDSPKPREYQNNVKKCVS